MPNTYTFKLENSCQNRYTASALLCGILIALLSSQFIYFSHFGISYPAVNTISALIALYLLLISGSRVWFWSGFFTGLFWFWWIGLSFIHYNLVWAIPFVELAIAGIYGSLFWLIAKMSILAANRWSIINSKEEHTVRRHRQVLFTLCIKALGLLVLSYIHPFTFDWFKPELMFVESYLGIKKWQFTLILVALVLTAWKRTLFFLLLLLLAYQPDHTILSVKIDKEIAIITTQIPVEEKWDKTQHKNQFKALFSYIDKAIKENKSLVILPESVFPIFLNREEILIDKLQIHAKKINIVTGALYWDGNTPHNSTYVFTRDGKMIVANKTLLVPFGEANPLPDFLSEWINKLFYDNAVDYKASNKIVDYTIDGKTYRNAICFEATSEILYEGNPENMIVLSNNGWFTPSIEPTLQRLLLQYYSKKYGTTIYHAVNMSPSYIIQKGNVVMP